MLTKQYFDKEHVELVTKEDLQRFFSVERQESDKIEFKSYVDIPGGGGTKKEKDKAKIEAIIQSICGFLNSDGGLLIWGAPEGKKSEDETIKEKQFVGELTGVSVLLEKDQFIGKISDVISPTPLRITFGKISLSETTYCYVFEIQKSEFSPHQYKGAYYMRLDGSTRPAPHHYVEALMKRVSYPRLQIGISFGKTRQFPKHFGMPVIVNIHNLSKTIHDKNVRYRILSIGGGLHKLGETNDYPERDCDITSKIRDIIHYNMPTTDQYYFVGRRIAGMQTLNVIISLLVWGELSPVLFSKYTLMFSYDPQSGQIVYSVDANENTYFFEQTSANNTDDQENLKHAEQVALRLFEEKIIENDPLFIQFLRHR